MVDLADNFEEVYKRSSPERRLISQIDPKRLPQHVAIIMDGNGRWARQRLRPRVTGHRAGIEAVKSAVETAARLTIKYLTLYAFSTENWKRPESEINTLMELLKEYLMRELDTLQKHGIRFQPIGHLDDLPKSVVRELRYAEAETRTNTGLVLTVALSYSGRQEIVDAVNRIIDDEVLPPVTDQDIRDRLYTRNLPDPDLLVRTSGEMRVSNFLLWQIAYAEIYVTEVLWPDFRGIHFFESVLDYQKRDRRFGGVPAPSLQETG